MYDLNIDDFCKDSAKIFLALFQKFPNKITLYVEDISGTDTPDEFGLHSPRHLSCYSTILWLSEEGYLRIGQSVRQEAFEDVVLSKSSFIFFATPELPNGFSVFESTVNDDTQANVAAIPRIKQLNHALTENSSDFLKNALLSYLDQLKP